jgi:4-carboxymuconolactone decarboxylase
MSKLNETAKRNHDEMFPNAIAALRETDPDFYDTFNNFAFGDVVSESEQDTKTRVLLILASTIGSQALTEYKFIINAALNVGASPIEIKEILYQSVPYVGMSKALDFIRTTNEVFKKLEIVLPLAPQSTTSPETRFEKGLAAQKTIFGDGIDKMYEGSPKDLLHIQKFLSENCFGDYYTRKSFDLKMRELITLSILIALGADPQVKAHIHGSLSMGATRSELVSLITQLLPWVGYPRALNAIGSLNDICPEKK